MATLEVLTMVRIVRVPCYLCPRCLMFLIGHDAASCALYSARARDARTESEKMHDK